MYVSYITFEELLILTARISYEQIHAGIGKSMCVCHSCWINTR